MTPGTLSRTSLTAAPKRPYCVDAKNAVPFTTPTLAELAGRGEPQLALVDAE